MPAERPVSNYFERLKEPHTGYLVNNIIRDIYVGLYVDLTSVHRTQAS